LTFGIRYWLENVHPFETTDNAYLKAHMSLISPKETGYVKQVLFDDNQHVNAGDLLVLIDDHDFNAKVAHAEAQITMEVARIQALEADKRTQNAKIRQQAAEIAAADAGLQRAAKDLKRFGRLAAEGAVSAQVHDAAEAEHKQTNARREKFRSAMSEATSELASLDARISEARAQLKANETALELAKIDLANTRIVAPMAGIVGNRSVQIGQLVQPGTVLAHLIPSEGLFVEANFKETQIARLRPGLAVDLRIDAYPDQAYPGIVDSFSPASGSEFSLLPPENATGNFTKIVRRVPVKIVFRPGVDTARLKPGLFTTVKVKVG
jgi:membrane fusion protein (multidrug efflux system)